MLPLHVAGPRPLFVALSLGLALSATGARADDAEREASLSPYERETIDLALEASGGALEDRPEGKIVEAVEIRPLDVFEPRDPLPGFFQDFLNFFHATTRPFVIERQVLLRVGEPYTQAAADETARNLRRIRQLSTVLVVAAKGSRADRVKVIVIAKDIWSLRLNSDFRAANDQLEYLLLAPSEENLGGLHHSASLRFELLPDTVRVGLGYKVPRIAGSWLQAAATTNVILSRVDGTPEGTSGSFSYGQPLYSTRAEWSWLGSIVWLDEKTRFFQGVEPLRYDAPSTPEDDAIPIQYSTDVLAGRVSFVRSFGGAVKHDLLFGAEASRQSYKPFGQEGLSPQVRREFLEDNVPTGETRLYPYVGYAGYATRFKSYQGFETLGLQEDFRVGHDVYVKLYPVFDALGATRTFFGEASGASASAELGPDGHLRVWAESVIEASAVRVWDARAAVGYRVVSPRFGVGRLIADGLWFQRFENFLNRRSTVGGEGRLRGYPSGAYRGENVIANNVELRSRAAELWTVQLGATAFYDSAAVWDHDELPAFRHDAGVGLRVVFPQLERTAMRLDWAVPFALDPDVGVTSIFPGRFVLTFEQAFPFPAVDPPFVTL